MFSQGCALVASFLLYHQAETPHLPPPFKVAVFICGGVPLQVLEDLGVPVSQEAHDWDTRSRQRLAEKTEMISTMKPGDMRWESSADIDPSTPLDPTNVFGLDITKVPANLRIKIPTVHIYGFKDPRYTAGVQLAQLCDPAVRRCYDHGGGHDIPRGHEVSEMIAGLLRWGAFMADC
jgi:Serine hydrolase (FSH1)